MYVRFVTARKVDGSSAREGFFVAAYELARRDEIDTETRRRAEEMLAWYRKHLPIPKRFNRSSSKGRSPRSGIAISWFKPTATEHLAKAHEMAALLSENGYPIDILKSLNPGYVTYEDNYQVVAEPFADSGGG